MPARARGLEKGRQVRHPRAGTCRVVKVEQRGGERWVQLEATGDGLFQKALFWARETELVEA